MHTTIHVLAAAAVLIVVAPAQAQSARVKRPSVLSMDVAGVRLNMTLAQARTALSGRYRCRTAMTEPSFAQLVEDEVAKRRGGSTPWGRTSEGIAALGCTGPNGEDVTVELAQTPAGPVVDYVFLRATGDAVDLDAVRPQIAAKYGPTERGDAVDGLRCDKGYLCGGSQALTRGPFLSTSTVGALTIVTARGAVAGEADAAAVSAAADRIAPKSRGAAF